MQYAYISLQSTSKQIYLPVQADDHGDRRHNRVRTSAQVERRTDAQAKSIHNCSGIWDPAEVQVCSRQSNIDLASTAWQVESLQKVQNKIYTLDQDMSLDSN